MVLLLACAAGCSSATLDLPMLSATEYLTELTTGICDKAFECRSSYPDGDSAFKDAWGSSQDDCYRGYQQSLMPAQIENDISRGIIAYDLAEASTCLELTTFPGCKQFWNAGPTFDDSCFDALVGTLANGKSCSVDYDCKSGQCDRDLHECTDP